MTSEIKHNAKSWTDHRIDRTNIPTEVRYNIAVITGPVRRQLDGITNFINKEVRYEVRIGYNGPQQHFTDLDAAIAAYNK